MKPVVMTFAVAAVAVAVGVRFSHSNQRPNQPPNPVAQSAASRGVACAPALLHPPGSFVANEGQWPGPTRYRAQFGAMAVRLAAREFWLDLAPPDAAQVATQAPAANGCALRLSFVGAGEPTLSGGDRLPGNVSYFVGGRDRWRADVPRYGSVHYRGLYPGLDVRAYEQDGHFEYDLCLAAGADLAAVEVEVAGADALRVDADGALAIATSVGEVRQLPPLTFALDARGTRTPIACGYELRGPTRFGFRAPTWDGACALLVDPGLVYSTFLGGGGEEFAATVAVGADGVVTVAGNTTSGDFPTTPGTFDASLAGNSDIFVAQLDPRQTGAQQLRYATFLGGTALDDAKAVAVHPTSGVITLVGFSASPEFPTTPTAYRQTLGLSDAVVVRLDPRLTGTQQLVYASFLGGSAIDNAVALAVDAAGVVTVVGTTRSADFPLSATPFDSTLNGLTDVFVTRLDPSLPSAQQVVYSTLYGGVDLDQPTAVHVAASGTITVAGYTSSNNLPMASAYDSTFGGVTDAFVARFDPSQSGIQQLRYATYLGGSGFEGGNALAVDATGVITLGGGTGSSTFPRTANAYRNTFAGSSEGFLVRLDPRVNGAAQLVYATLLGGAGGSNEIVALAADSAGVITVTGTTSSVNFPTTPGAFDTSFHGNFDAFVSRLDPALSGTAQLTYSTCLGSATLSDRGWAIAVDAQGAATVVGNTSSFDFPVTPGALFATARGGTDGFVSRLDMLPTGVTRAGAASPGCSGSLAIGITRMPRVGASDLQLTCNGVPPAALGVLLLGTARSVTPVRLLGVDVWVDLGTLFFAPTTSSDNFGACRTPLPLPADPTLAGFGFTAQFLWGGPTSPPPCPPLGVSASDALDVVVQP